MKHKIVLCKDGYLTLHRKRNWYSKWEYVYSTQPKKEWDPEYDGMKELQKYIEADLMKDLIVATYTNGKEDVTRPTLMEPMNPLNHL